MRFQALIVDADVAARNRLKQAATTVPDFGKVEYAAALKDGLTRLQLGAPCDVVFVAGREKREEIQQFIKDGKLTTAGQDAAFVMTLGVGAQDTESVAATMLVGADGLLFEPYSVEQLVEVSRLAARVKKERAVERERVALKFLFSDMMQQVDQLAQLKKLGYDVAPTLKRFREMCSVLRILKDESLLIYLQLVIEMFENAKLPPPPPPGTVYRGISTRVRKRMVSKITGRPEDC